MLNESTAALPADAEIRIVVERNRLLYGALVRSVVASLVCAAALAAVTAIGRPFAREVAWLAVFAAVGAVRLALLRRYRAHADDRGRARDFEALFVGGAALAGAVWGVGAFLLFPDTPFGQAFIGFVFAGVSGGAVTSLGPSRRAATAFLLLTLGPISLRYFLVGTFVTTAMGALTVLLIFFLLGSARSVGSMLDENLRLRLAEEVREASLRRQRDLLERAGLMARVGGWEYHVLDDRLEWSPQVYRIYGRDPEITPRLATMLLPYRGDARRVAEESLNAAIHEGAPYDLELPFLSNDGRRLRVRVQGRADRVDGRIVTLVGTVQDVTDRSLAEEALRRNLRALEALYEITSDPALSLDGKLDRILALGLDVLGLDLAVVGRVDGDGYTVRAARGVSEPAPAPGAVFALGETYATLTLSAWGPTSFHHVGESELHDHPSYRRYRLKAYIGCPLVVDGERHGVVELLARDPRPEPFTPSDHALVQVFAEWIGFEISRDRATRRTEEYGQRLEATLAMQRAILDSTNYSIIATDVDGVIRTFSRGAERMLGYEAAEMEGRATPEAFHDEEEMRERATALAEELGRRIDPGFPLFVALSEVAGGVDEREWTYVRKDGTHVPALLSVTGVRSESGELLGYVGVAADLTERKRVERLKKEFVSTVSHELRTPLTSIRGSLGLVVAGAAGELPERAGELLRVAARNCERLILLINDILDTEKIESGKLDVVLRPQPLGPLVDQAVQSNESFADQHGVRVVFAVEGDPWAEVDENRLIQVATNLISNAAKFSPAGGTVEVRVAAVDGRAVVSVSDRGPGIPDEFRGRIFEKFTQVDASDRRAKGGTGLGLAISRGLVQAMRGEIDFESATGVGTTFRVAFPLVRALGGDAGLTSPSRGAPATPAADGSPRSG